MLRMQERAEEQQQRIEARTAVQFPPVYSITQPFHTSQRPRPSTPAYATNTVKAGHPPTSSSGSSPINGEGKADTRSTVREFMRWLVSEQPEEDRTEYERAQEIIVEQMWTVGDLRDMSSTSSELYRIATSEPFRLRMM